MLRKTQLSTILLLAFSSSAFCSGFYVGAGVGPENIDFAQTAHFTQGTNVNVFNNTQGAASGAFGTIFAGYGWTHNRFYLAGELNANANSAKFQSSNLETIHGTVSNTTYQMNPSYGISILPGFSLSKTTLFYGRLGYANSAFDVTTTDTSLANTSTTLNGFRFGAGIEQFITERFAVRLEYSQTDYQDMTIHVVGSNFAKETKNTPEMSQVEFGMILNFA